jgi:UDP-2-acetamido-3-amino-2,3-dideoxy-glucuronate N-acetyltransferase
MSEYLCISNDVKIGKDVKLSKFINLYGCSIGNGTKIGAFVEIQKNSVIGENCKISSHTFICEGVTIGNNCFIGHGVMFINDNYPRSASADGTLETEEDWADRFVKTKIENNVSIGSNATILGNVTIGNGALIGAGSVVTSDVPQGQIWAGNPAQMIRDIAKERK